MFLIKPCHLLQVLFFDFWRGERTFSKLIFIGVDWTYNVVLVPAVQQTKSSLRVQILPPIGTSFPVRSPQTAEQSSLSSAAGSHYSSILQTESTVDTCQSQSPSSSHPTTPHSPLVSTRSFSMSVYFCFANKIICTTSLYSMYVC